MEITCYRDAVYAQEPRLLPAATYNLARTLLSRTTNSCLFVPMRSIQYLAILDDEEFVFIDGIHKCWIEIAWRNFRPSQRTALDQAVAYEAVFYNPNAAQLMSRLQRELPLALQQLAHKDVPHEAARMIKFDRRKLAPT